MLVKNVKLVYGLRVYCVYNSIRYDGIISYLDEFYYRILWSDGEEMEYDTFRLRNAYIHFYPKFLLLRKVVI